MKLFTIITISPDAWVGLIGVGIGALITTLITYPFDTRKEKREERQKSIERASIIFSQFEGLMVKLRYLAQDAIQYHYGLMYVSKGRSILKDKNFDDGADWERKVRTARENSLLYTTAKQKYVEALAQAHTLITEFDFYLPDGERLPNSKLARYKITRFSFLASMSEEDFNKLDKKKLVNDMDVTYINELSEAILPLVTRMRSRVDELKKKIRK